MIIQTDRRTTILINLVILSMREGFEDLNLTLQILEEFGGKIIAFNSFDCDLMPCFQACVSRMPHNRAH